MLHRDPHVLKAKTKQMEDEKETLQDKVDRVKEKTSGVENFKVLLLVCCEPPATTHFISCYFLIRARLRKLCLHRRSMKHAVHFVNSRTRK